MAEKLFCSSCKGRSFDDGTRTLYLCRIRTESGFEFEDWYATPKEIGYYTIHVNVKKFNVDGKKRFLPIAKLGEYAGLVLDSEGQDSTPVTEL